MQQHRYASLNLQWDTFTAANALLKSRQKVTTGHFVETLLVCSGPVHRFAESEVTINYRRPIRNLQSSNMQQDIDEEDLKQLQAEHMRRVYEQERRRKYLQELEDIESRRHMDNFTYMIFHFDFRFNGSDRKVYTKQGLGGANSCHFGTSYDECH